MIRCVSGNVFSRNASGITFMIKDVYVDIIGDLSNLIENDRNDYCLFDKLFYKNEFI
jgi:hypothetical protein